MRRTQKYKKQYKSDVKYSNTEIGRFINYLFKDGKRSIAETIMYKALDIVGEKTKQEPVEVFKTALNNASPLLEVKSRRVGGANYQVPQEVRGERKFYLACNWIINAAKNKKGKSMAEKLAEEIIFASQNEGAAIKKKQDMHKMAEANRAFAHFAW